MRRREFIRVVGGAAAFWPLSARAQRAIPKVGVLMVGFEGSAETAPRLAAFRKALAERGWREGENIQIEYRWSAGKGELILQYAKELVASAPDVILANSTPVVLAKCHELVVQDTSGPHQG